jgi:molecular chaperone DnaK
MRRDAEAHASEDKAKREMVDLKNQADAAIHDVEKQLAENAEKIPAEVKSGIESARDELKKASEGSDKDALQRALTAFQTQAQKMGEAIYKQQAGAAGAQQPGAAPTGESHGNGSTAGSDEPVDADFEVKA